jgi:DNA repair exonuclease SbcCD ATPase subunit
MINLEQIIRQLEEAFEPAQAEKIALTLYEMTQSLYERQLIQHIDALSVQLRQFEQRMTERFDALTEQTQRNTEAIAVLAEQTQRNTEAIAALAEQTQRNTEAIARHEAILERHSELIAENSRAIRALQESMEQMRQHFTERIDALEQHFTQRIDALERSMEEMRRHFTERIDALEQHFTQRIDALEQHFTQRIDALEQHFTQRIDVLEQSMEVMRQHFTQRLDKLERRVDDLAKQVGGLAITVGYTLENEAYKALPALLLRDHGLQVIGRLKRGYAVDAEGNAYEVNILGAAQRDGQRLTIIGESKAQLSKQDIDRFVRRKLKPLQRIYGTVFPIIVTHMTTSPDVERHARERGVTVYYSYDF